VILFSSMRVVVDFRANSTNAPACASNTLAPLPLREGALRLVTLYLVVADPAGAGPGTLHLRDIFQTIAADNATGNGALG
jgi:hypothetical protein